MSGKQFEHLVSCFHGVNCELVSTVEYEHNRLQKPPLCVEPETKLPGRTALIEFLDPKRPHGRLNDVFRCYAMLQRGGVNLHAADAASASRMISERVFPSRVARASMADNSSAVRRSAITCDGSAPRPGRPRPRFFRVSTSYPASASAAHAAICPSVTGVPLMVSSVLILLMYDEM